VTFTLRLRAGNAGTSVMKFYAFDQSRILENIDFRNMENGKKLVKYVDILLDSPVSS